MSDAVRPASAAPERPWWRRNWWGLAAVVPLLAGVVLASPDDTFQTFRDQHSEQVVRPGADGWAGYGDARLRVAGFGPAELFDGDGEPFAIPGLSAWQVTVAVALGADPDALLGCDIELEDDRGRRFMDGPSEIGAASDSSGLGVYAADCTRPFDEEGETGPFETVAYFLLPESAEPVSLRVTHYTLQPAYVRIDVG